jgi:CBS domain-containing protein
VLCREIMKREVECVSPQTTVQEAAKKMRAENIGFLPVCENGTKVVGTITDRDLAIRVLADGRPATQQVKEVLTREIVSCRPDDDVHKAEQLMSTKHKSRIMCIDEGGRLVGVISLSDIARVEDASRVADTMKRVSEREAKA